jgi:hypothetical protein
LTITGEGFPIDPTAITVTFTDGTGCTVLGSSDVELTCEVDGFEQSGIDYNAPQTVTVTMDTFTNSDESVTIKEQAYPTPSITPNSVSPVLPNDLVI